MRNINSTPSGEALFANPIQTDVVILKNGGTLFEMDSV